MAVLLAYQKLYGLGALIFVRENCAFSLVTRISLFPVIRFTHLLLCKQNKMFCQKEYKFLSALKAASSHY